MNDKKLMKWILFILLLPLTLAYFSGDRFRYPCQDPNNWDKQMCKLPYCDVTRTCPEHIFKGQNDPRVGPDGDKPMAQKQASTPVTGANCK